MDAGQGETDAAPLRGVVGRAGSTSLFDLDRWEPSEVTGRFVEHFWSVSWDLRGQEPLANTVITFPSLHITHEWGSGSPRHGFSLPNTLVHGVVERVFRTTIGERGTVVGARFRTGGFTARFGRDAAALTGRVEPVDDDLFGAPIHLEDNIESAAAGLDAAIAVGTGEIDPTYAALTALVDRMRDDDRLHRVEQVMQLSPWSARTTQRVFRRYVGVRVNGFCAAIGYSRLRWRSRATRASTSPIWRSASAGTTRRISSTISARCWAARPANTPRRTAVSPGRSVRACRGSSQAAASPAAVPDPARGLR